MTIGRHAELIFFKSYSDLKTETSRTYIGILWWIFDPILYMGVFYLVFGVLLAGSRGGGQEDYVSFLLVGLVVWRWFNGSVTNGINSILSGRGLMRQIYLPKLVFPLADFASNTFKFLIILALLLVYLWIRGYTPGFSYLWLPFLLIVEAILILGCAILVAAVVPFLPDLRFLIQHGLTVMFFMSGIFFSGEQIPAEYRDLFYLNPMARIIEDARDILIYGEPPAAAEWLAPLGIGLAILLFAVWLVSRFDHVYPKLRESL